MENPIKKNMRERIKLLWKIWVGVIATIVLFSILSLSPNLFKGDIFEGWISNTGNFYIPNYPANAGDVGDIQIVSTNALSNIGGFSFTLVYNSNKITIPDNAVTADEFDFVNSNNISDGRLKVIGASGDLDGIDFAAGADLVKIDELTLSSGLSEGEILTLSIEDFEIVTSYNWTLTSDTTETVTSGKITIGESQIGTLQLLSAVAVDSTTVKLTFSDYLTNIGNFTFDNNLTAVSAEIDSDDGKTILITTSTQKKGTLYEVVASGTTGNTKGALSSTDAAYFTGPGAITVDSDFDLKSATATSGTGLTLYFSDAISASSIYTNSMFLTETNNVANSLTILNATKSSANTKALNLTLTGTSILDENTNYQITLNKSGLSTDLRRESDSALLGKNTTTFAGYSASGATNVFGIDAIEAIETNQILVTFTENLSATTVDLNDFSLSGFNINSYTIPYNGSYADVLLELNSEMTAGQYYTLVVNDSNGLQAYAGNSLGAENSMVFAGYGTYSSTSEMSLDSATANSATKIKLTFSQAPLTSTITPVNFTIKPTLTITDASVSDSTVTLTTAVQTAWTLYTVIANADKIKDRNWELISSKNTITVEGYTETEPEIDSITPTQLENTEDQTILIAGSNFESGTAVYLDTLLLKSTVTASEITITVPAETEAGVYDLILKRPNGEQITQENAVIIEDSEESIQVLSEQSYASPKIVPNDGETTTTLWVRISDPNGVSDIDAVYLDLRPINGNPAKEMKAGSIVDTKRWYSLEITVPETVATSDTAISLEVTAQNQTGDKAYGTVSLTVNNDTTSSIAPVVEEAYSSPTLLSPWSDEAVYFYAYVTDEDGADTLNTVVINLGPIGGLPMVMETITTTTKTTTTTTATGTGTTSYLKWLFAPQALATFTAPTSDGQWYKTTAPFNLPTNMRESSYSLTVTATDETGETGKLTFIVKTSVNANKPEIDSDKVYITPSTSLPNDNETVFVLYAYVEDPDGIDNIVSVTADLEEINLAPATMTTETTTGLGGWYKTPELVIPTDTFKGVKNLEIYALDKSGAEDEVDLDIKVINSDDVGDAPVVSTTESYTTPSLALNDETTTLSLYAYVSDEDDDIDYVTVNLSNIARYTGNADSSDFYTVEDDETNPCETNSDTIVCMSPSVKEGTNGHWYVLSDVVVVEEVEPSIEPYMVWVTAVDETGQSSQGYININVSDGNLPTQEVGYPTVRLAAATSPTTVEVLFSNPITVGNLSKTGTEFTIAEKNNTSEELNITKAVVNTEGTIVTLTTAEQVGGVNYSVVADADDLGLKNNQISDTSANFVGYEDEDIPPQIVKVMATSSYLVEVIFSNALKPTSISSDGSDFEIFTAEGTAEDLAVQNAEISDQYTVIVSTDAQISNQAYRIRAKNIQSAAGLKVKASGLTKEFTGFENILNNSGKLVMTADFNADGKIDFSDFTIFSSVYGQVWKDLQSGVTLEEALENNNLTEDFDPLETTTEVPEE